MFIPSGYLRLSDAILELAERHARQLFGESLENIKGSAQSAAAVEAAISDLGRALADEKLLSEVIDERTGDKLGCPAKQWRTGAAQRVIWKTGYFSPNGSRRLHVVISREEFERWLVAGAAPNDGSGPATSSEAGEISAPVLARAAPPPEISPSNGADARSAQHSATTRPKPSNQAVREWIRGRVAGWPDEEAAPTEDEDFEAAKSHFGDGLTRAEFRIVREEGTPQAWRKQGRRKPWGRQRYLPVNLPIRGRRIREEERLAQAGAAQALGGKDICRLICESGGGRIRQQF
jgi:hypothetical protein